MIHAFTARVQKTARQMNVQIRLAARQPIHSIPHIFIDLRLIFGRGI